MFLIPSVNSGGIETFLLRFLQTKGDQLNSTIIIRNNQAGDLLEEYSRLNVHLIFLPLSYFNPIRWIKYYKLFRSGAYHTLCDFNANFAGLTVTIARLAKIKNRIAFYRQGSNHFKKTIFKQTYNYLMNKLVYLNSTVILANSKAGMDYFFSYRKANDSRFKLVYNGVDFSRVNVSVDKSMVRKEVGIPEDSFVIGHVGRADVSKNHQTILEVAANIIRRYPNAYLILCGNGTERLQNMVTEQKVLNNIRFLGFRSDVYHIMKIFDVFYFPSLTEGQPNALLEAMALGIPVVASNIQPIKEIMPDDIRLYDPYDTTGVTKRIIDIIENKEAYHNNDLTNYIIKQFNVVKKFDEFFEIISDYEN